MNVAIRLVAAQAAMLDGRDIRTRAEQEIAIEAGENIRKRDGAQAADAHLIFALYPDSSRSFV